MAADSAVSQRYGKRRVNDLSDGLLANTLPTLTKLLFQPENTTLTKAAYYSYKQVNRLLITGYYKTDHRLWTV